MESPDFTFFDQELADIADRRTTNFASDIYLDLRSGISYREVVARNGGFEELQRLVGPEYAQHLIEEALKEGEQ